MFGIFHFNFFLIKKFFNFKIPFFLILNHLKHKFVDLEKTKKMLASGEQKLECIWFVTYIYDPEAQAHLNLDCTLLVNVLSLLGLSCL
jgi:hypothetical protein